MAPQTWPDHVEHKVEEGGAVDHKADAGEDIVGERVDECEFAKLRPCEVIGKQESAFHSIVAGGHSEKVEARRVEGTEEDVDVDA